MNQNGQTMTQFYSAFRQLDYKAMQDCYAAKVIFFDPVFEDLVDDEVRWMWQMLCERAKDLQVTFSGVRADEEYGSCQWVAVYTFGKTGRRIVNRITAHMRFVDGKIIEHSDQFRLSAWCRQAFGLSGVLLGRTGWFQRRVKTAAQRSLYDYIVARQKPA